MELLKGLETRKTCRAFLPTPVPAELIERILKAASKSPSFRNSQPWEVAVVSGRKRDELSSILLDLAKSDNAPMRAIPEPENWPPELERRMREHGANRFKNLGIERANKQQREEQLLKNFEFYGASCVIFLYIDKALTAWSIFDLGLFAQTLILAAHSFGIGSCLQASITDYPDAIRDFLGLPDNKLLVLGISLGYPDSNSRQNTYQSARVSLNDFVRFYT